MKNFKGRSSFGDRGSKGGFGGRPQFEKKDFGSRDRDFGGRGEMFTAVCANCGKTCEVPFKPNGKKPVYCTECFSNGAGGDSAPRGNSFDNRFEKTFEQRVQNRDSRDSAPFRAPRPAAPAGDDRRMEQLQREINIMGTKLDRVIDALDRLARPSTQAPKAEAPKAAPTPVVATPSAKAPKPTAKAAPKKAVKKEAPKKAPAKKKTAAKKK